MYNNLYKILPKRKLSKKRPSSAKRSASLTEQNNPKKLNNNSERFFTTYDEVFEKLNSKINKGGIKHKANSASKKRTKNSLSKKNSKKNSIERKNLRNIYTYNTNYTTQNTDNNKIRCAKKSPKKEKFNEILNKAKDLLSIQSDLVLQCGKLSQNLSKSDLDINTRMKNDINDNDNNALPGLAKALYLLECKRDNKPVNYNFNKNNNYSQEQIENSFYIQILNELNKFLGELGYSYVYNEFDEMNYKKENILIYFNNFHKLLSILHQTINEQKEMLMKQSNQIKEYEKYLQNYQYNNLENSISSKNDNQNIYINENNELQNNIINENNNSNNSLFNNNSSHEFTQLQNCTNVFKNNGNISQKNRHYFNSYMNKNEIYKEQNLNNLNESENNLNEFDKQFLPPEMSNNYLNYYKNQNQNKNMISSMINSESFFESYKRNKDMKHNLNYNYNYNEKSVNNE